MHLIQHSFFNIPSWPVFRDFVTIEGGRPFATELLRWQWIGLLVCLALCLNSWLVPARWLIWVRLQLHNLAQHRKKAIFICALFPIIVRVALLPAIPVKPPSVHDEFSLLLMADTFRSGRLTNPTHPFWEHFETIHVIQKPTYNSMYPPGSGAIFAFGELFHDPWIGVLLSVGIMCGALCWMMQAWLPAGWAFGGTLVAALQTGIGSYWMNSYVGPAPVPAMAGALLLGAMPRFLRSPKRTTAAVFAIGVVLLVNTRPFEGTFLSVLCLAIIGWSFYRPAPRLPSFRWRILAPAFLILLFGGLFTVYDSWKVTGNPFKTAYVVNRETYGWPENLAFLPPQKLTYRHKILENMHNLELSRRERYTTFGRMLNSWCARVAILWEFYVGPSLSLPLLLLPWVLRRSQFRLVLYVCLAVLSLNTLQLMAYPQHVAPEMPIFYLLLTAGMRWIYVLVRRKGFIPERLLCGIFLGVACGAAFNLCMEPLHIRPGTFWEWPHWQYFGARAAMVAKLNQMPGNHLVIVRYAATHSAHEEWIYNAADIDASKIVWANAMGFGPDMELRNYFHDRQVWIVEPDRDPNGFFPLTRKTYEQ